MDSYIVNQYTSNDSELDAYVGLCGEAAELLAQLTEYVANHGNVDPEAVGYFDVNRMRVIVNHLKAARTATKV